MKGTFKLWNIYFQTSDKKNYELESQDENKNLIQSENLPLEINK